jgi:hypothetical protein
MNDWQERRDIFSRSLRQPEELQGAEAVEIIQEYDSLPPVFTSSYYSDFHGKVEHFEYNPLRYDYNAYKDSVEALEERCVNEAFKQFGDLVEVI